MEEKELQDTCQRQLIELEIMRKKNIMSMDDIDEAIPGFFHISYRSLNLCYLGKSMADRMELTNDDVVNMDDDFFKTYVAEDTLCDEHPKFMDFYDKKSKSKIYAGFQKIRLRPTADYEMYFTMLKYNSKDDTLVGISNRIKDLQPLARKLEYVVDMNTFLKKNFKKFALLTNQEVEILKLIALGKKRNVIAGQLSISLNTLDTHRNNIRKKLETKSVCDFIKYAQAFDLI